MDFRQIQELIKMINKSNIGELSIEQKDFKLTIKQKEDAVTQVVSAPPFSMPMPVAPAQITAPQTTQAAAPTEKQKAATPTSSNNTIVRSPMIGTFYRKPSPDKPDFVEQGTIITPGKVICVIEAMKLFNEIESEISGKVVKILVEDASPVEFDQPLFEVETA
ncbi:acetyl-CoA carboxylase biotin carboxyl carrier protein [Niabella ginsengisoli]|uniref:Biotin carboxyl carrier protein of acetyl-CoA carboxylase n=1 Tax=Niabella ginsengisoli TaxID=522298 RepID=A0ABS9SLW7_9BACT|nr:acetyl-CoA carboxylase biotin carboxyl carrier protein [Niabella ginsengisoli]MCH5599370.1 acetyl-CoA carboxylase biotin carboxyl carrier protein [Niabella ginsengisoli]